MSEVFTDMVAFLMGMPELKMRKSLFFIFQLSCQCLTTKLPELPAIKLPGVDSSEPRSRLFDVIMPAQSYLANVANSVAACTTEASLGTFKDLEARFSSGNVPGDPRSHVDSFGKSNFHKVLVSVHKSLGKSVRPDIEPTSNSSFKEGGNSASSLQIRAKGLASGPLVDPMSQSPLMETLPEPLNLKCTKSTFVLRLCNCCKLICI